MYNEIVLNKQLFDALTEQAKASPRLRTHFDLRDSSDDDSQRMLNAIEPGSIFPIHRHNATSETIAILRGKLEEILYDNRGNETARILLEPGGDNPAIQIPIGQYHTVHSLESGTVILEIKNTKYNPDDMEEFHLEDSKQLIPGQDYLLKSVQGQCSAST